MNGENMDFIKIFERPTPEEKARGILLAISCIIITSAAIYICYKVHDNPASLGIAFPLFLIAIILNILSIRKIVYKRFLRASLKKRTLEEWQGWLVPVRIHQVPFSNFTQVSLVKGGTPGKKIKYILALVMQDGRVMDLDLEGTSFNALRKEGEAISKMLGIPFEIS